MFNRNHNDPSIDEVEARLRAASPEVSDLDLDRLKRRIQTQVNLRRSTRGANLRYRLVPVLVSLGLLGGTGFFAVEAFAASTSTSQYSGPSPGTSGRTITITGCALGNVNGGGNTYGTLTITGTTTDGINSILVTNTSSPGGSETVTPTGSSSPYSFTATLSAGGYKTGKNYVLTAAQHLGGTATATCTT